jgi:flagellar biogenesis protein FliO
VLTLTGGFIFIILLLVVFGVFILKQFLKQNTLVTNLRNTYRTENSIMVRLLQGVTERRSEHHGINYSLP